ncbi:phage minor structural protein [Staphylococcus aureus]|uniref:Phage minor structural protein n=1 Tax=Staphylococcus aureus TaxID=1280 RepID=A0A2X2K4T2_STAAU|nr:phage minor structural protein [Staphylococcus aureus]
MRDKVDKTDIVNSLNLSREGLDINVNRIGIKGGNNNRYVQIQNDSIELGGIVQRTWKGKRSTDDIFTRLKDGHLRFRNNTAGGSLYMSHLVFQHILMEKAKTEVHPVLFNGGIKLTVIAV